MLVARRGVQSDWQATRATAGRLSIYRHQVRAEKARTTPHGRDETARAVDTRERAAPASRAATSLVRLISLPPSLLRTAPAAARRADVEYLMCASVGATVQVHETGKGSCSQRRWAGTWVDGAVAATSRAGR